MEDDSATDAIPDRPLRRGWTTGACATAATKSALNALFGGGFLDPVEITLPGGQTPAFVLALEARETGWAEAGIVKDAGDDPDVTHGATIIARVARGASGSGVTFHAGPGIGTITRPGLSLPPGEPAINPVPRRMMREAVSEICARFGEAPDIAITLSIPNGDEIAKRTWNPRLGIVGGLSVLGTTGIVVPYSCSAWIHSIQRGVDVARAMGLSHVVGATGDRSEQAARAALGLADEAYLDMGDFVGGLLKYLRTHRVDRVTIAGGFGKLVKLAQGAMDLHSARSTIDMAVLAKIVGELGGDDALVARCASANTAREVLALCQAAGLPLAARIATLARQNAETIVNNSTIHVCVIVVGEATEIVGRSEE
ncbi:MAG: cobalt-precorrin-5B (C(1))-methyltransferase [Alphaproteobacteria bacterium]|nr:cobalt-precorrin-5B (C(1))-methyltransferase [Alphaproteobacteria bacterium]